MKPDYVTLGFEQIHTDLQFLVGAFADVLRELGHGELSTHLPWLNPSAETTSPVDKRDELPVRLGLAYSVAFQLLNMVEENAAAAMREIREESEGLPAQKGLWG